MKVKTKSKKVNKAWLNDHVNDPYVKRAQKDGYRALIPANRWDPVAAQILGVRPASIRGTLRNFKGVEHRLEFVRELDGVKYINDSKATNVDSVWYALQAYREPLVLLLGGRDHLAVVKRGVGLQRAIHGRDGDGLAAEQIEDGIEKAHGFAPQ